MNRATMQMAQDYLGRIKELEKENAELKHNKKTIVHLADCLAEKMKERIEELETQLKWEQDTKSEIADFLGKANSENAELKKKIGIYQKGMYDEIEKRDRKLTKAKEIIKQFLNDYPVITKELLDKLEQFIKEIEEND